MVAGGTLPLALLGQTPRFGLPLVPLPGQPLQFHHFGIPGVFLQRLLHGSLRAGIVAVLQVVVDLLHPARFFFQFRMLIAPFPQSIDLQVQAGIAAVDRLQRLPLRDGLAELGLLFG